MRSIVFFGILTLLPSIISAGPMSVVRPRDDSDSSLADAAFKLMSTVIDINIKFVAVGLTWITSSSPAFGAMKNYQSLLSQDVFTAFSPTISELNCNYGNLASLITTDANKVIDADLFAAITWGSLLIKMIADSIVSNATELGLDPNAIQTIQSAGEAGSAIANIFIFSAPPPIAFQDASLPYNLANWEGVQLVKVFLPQCNVDPGIELLGLPGIKFVYLDSPFSAGLGAANTVDMSGSCPNGNNDTNCFCQTISPNASQPVVSPPLHCQMTTGPGMNAFYLTEGSQLLSVDPGVRTQQVANGSINIVAGPMQPMFAPTTN